MIAFEVESKSIWTFGFSTLYTVLPRFDLISALKKIVVISEVINYTLISQEDGYLVS